MQCPDFLLFISLCVLISNIDSVSCINRKNLVSEMKYDIQLKLDPIDAGSESTVEMYSKYGQRFICVLPSESRNTNTVTPPPVDNTLVSNMLSLLNGSKCLIYRHSWWTYELCYGRYVLQYHAEEQERSSETLLGLYDSETNWTEPRNETDDEQLYHSQFYVNGSYCELTLSRRKVEVRYVCETGNSFLIIRVEEPETCVYRIYVAAPTLCSHPSFVVTRIPRIESIKCSPEVANASVTEDSEHAEHANATASSKRFYNHSLSRSSKRVFTIPAILKKMQIRRRHFERRYIRFMLKQFLRSITSPVLHGTQLTSPDIFRMFLDDARDSLAPQTSLSWSLHRWSLRRCADELQQSLLHFASSTIQLFLSHSKGIPVHPKSLSVMHILATFMRSFIDAQLQYFEHPDKKPVIFPFELVSVAADLFSKLSDQLPRIMSPHLADAVRLDLDVLLALYNRSAESTDSIELVGMDLDNVTFTLGLRGLNAEHPAWTTTPVEIEALRSIRHRFQPSLQILKNLHQLVRMTEQIKKMESDFETTMENLLVTATNFKVLVVRSAVDGASTEGDASDDDHSEPQSSESTSHPSSQNVLEIVKNVLRKLSPESPQDLTVYETTSSAKGTSMFVIMSSEEKGREERRMDEMESAYNFKKSSPTAQNQPE
ncbi:unnamed protein product [Dicrocoelium dendriticum]|nr:unnamed protein product [Dicrocoelium dendriticum]